MTVKQNKYYPRQLTFGRETSVVDVVFMYNSPEEFHKTSVHTVWSKTQNGKTFPRSVECHKQHTFGDIREATPCAICEAEQHVKVTTGGQYYPNQARAYAWVIDKNAEAGNRLKWIEIPYTLEQAISQQMLMQPGIPLSQLPIKLIKTVEAQGNRNKTTYSAGISGAVLDPYDRLVFAREHGMQSFPSIVGPKGVSPVEQVTSPTELGNIQAQIVTNYNEFAAKQGYPQAPMMQTVQQPEPIAPAYNPAYSPAAVNPGYAVNGGQAQSPQFTGAQVGAASPFTGVPSQVQEPAPGNWAPGGGEIPIAQPEPVSTVQQENPFPQVATETQTPPLGNAPAGAAQTQPIGTATEQPVTQPLQGQNPFPQQGQVFTQVEEVDEMPTLDITSDDLPF